MTRTYSRTASTLHVHNDFVIGASGMTPATFDFRSISNSTGCWLDSRKYGHRSRTITVLCVMGNIFPYTSCNKSTANCKQHSQIYYSGHPCICLAGHYVLSVSSFFECHSRRASNGTKLNRSEVRQIWKWPKFGGSTPKLGPKTV